MDSPTAEEMLLWQEMYYGKDFPIREFLFAQLYVVTKSQEPEFVNV